MNSKTILIVDDNEFDRSFLRNALSTENDLRFLEAENGQECFRLLTQEKIDLVVLDISLPGERGPSILKKIRRKFELIELPVIMVTSTVNPSMMVRCLQSGANDYITKPVNMKMAVSRISAHLRLTELSREITQARELAAYDALIATYNHEVNNALTVALGCVDQHSTLDNPKTRENLRVALLKLDVIVQKIELISRKKEIIYEDYVDGVKILKTG